MLRVANSFRVTIFFIITKLLLFPRNFILMPFKQRDNYSANLTLRFHAVNYCVVGCELIFWVCVDALIALEQVSYCYGPLFILYFYLLILIDINEDVWRTFLEKYNI
jgi:hypothetical protein